MKKNTFHYIIDFRKIEYYMEIHPIIKRSLNLPDYYGCNWSALWDCLTDMYNMTVHIEILGLDIVERKFGNTARQLIKILKEYKHYDNDRYSHDINIEIVDGDKRITLE